MGARSRHWTKGRHDVNRNNESTKSKKHRYRVTRALTRPKTLIAGLLYAAIIAVTVITVVVLALPHSFQSPHFLRQEGVGKAVRCPFGAPNTPGGEDPWGGCWP